MHKKSLRIKEILRDSKIDRQEFFGNLCFMISGEYDNRMYWIDVYPNEILVHRKPFNDDDQTLFSTVEEVKKFIESRD